MLTIVCIVLSVLAVCIYSSVAVFNNVYTHAHIYTYLHTYIHTYTYVETYIHTYAYTYLYLCMHTNACILYSTPVGMH